MIWYLVAAAVAVAAVGLVVLVGLGCYGQVKGLKALVADRTPALGEAGKDLTEGLEELQRRQAPAVASRPAAGRSRDGAELAARVRQTLGG